MRATPVIVFINKMDRMGKDPFELLDEIEQKLNLKVSPLRCPVGMGPEFKGVYNLYQHDLVLFRPHGKQTEKDLVRIKDLSDPTLEKHLGNSFARTLREEADLIQGVYPPFDREVYLKGEVSPVFFGSAINNFGVKDLLDCFVEIAPPPGSSR